LVLPKLPDLTIPVRFLKEKLTLPKLPDLSLPVKVLVDGVEQLVKKLDSIFKIPDKKVIKIAAELKTLALPASLAISLFSPVNAISSPVNEIQKVFNTAEVHQIESKEFVKSEKVFQTEKLLKAEKVLKEKLVTERIERERILEGKITLPPMNVQVTINNLTVGSKEDAPAVAKEIASLNKAELKRLLFEIYEELERKRY